jgi:hypothetical protein
MQTFQSIKKSAIQGPRTGGSGGGLPEAASADGLRELVAVEFLDDITLRCEDDQSGASYEVRVRRGSVFRVAP